MGCKTPTLNFNEKSSLDNIQCNFYCFLQEKPQYLTVCESLLYGGVSPLVGWPHQHLKIRPLGLPSHHCGIPRMDTCIAIALITGKGWRISSEPVEYPPCCRWHKREAYRHEEAKKSGSDYYNYKGFFLLVLLFSWPWWTQNTNSCG